MLFLFKTGICQNILSLSGCFFTMDLFETGCKLFCSLLQYTDPIHAILYFWSFFSPFEMACKFCVLVSLCNGPFRTDCTRLLVVSLFFDVRDKGCKLKQVVLTSACSQPNMFRINCSRLVSLYILRDINCATSHCKIYTQGI